MLNTRNVTMDYNPNTIWNMLGGVFLTIASGILIIRKWISRDKLERAGDREGEGMYARLNKLLNEEREARIEADKRADMFAKERNEAIMQIGELRGQVQALTSQVEQMRMQLTNYVKQNI